ncbi:hypothetical protein ACFQ0B_40420 [Nonomuraea thailandensis]
MTDHPADQSGSRPAGLSTGAAADRPPGPGPDPASPTSPVMVAARIENCGRPPVVADGSSPVPGAGQELVRVLAAPITPLDLLCASGTSYFGTPALPYVPGVQGWARWTGGWCGSRRRRGWRRATGAWRSWPWYGPRTWSICPPAPTRTPWRRSGCRRWPRTWR